MKRYLKKLLTLAFIPLMLASCKDDVSEVNNENTNNDVTENQNENNNDENNSNEENNNGNNEDNNTPKKVEVGDINLLYSPLHFNLHDNLIIQLNFFASSIASLISSSLGA